MDTTMDTLTAVSKEHVLVEPMAILMVYSKVAMMEQLLVEEKADVMEQGSVEMKAVTMEKPSAHMMECMRAAKTEC
jgi:hypothetical protein